MKHFKTMLFSGMRWIGILPMLLLVLSGCDFDDDPEPCGTIPQLSFLTGEWIRIDGNNPSANGMRVKVTDDFGEIVEPSKTTLSVGDIKWQSITPTEDDIYEHQELGSDGNYYDATITIVNDDEIEIRVASSGAGNLQRWVRFDGTDLVALQGPWTRIESNNPSNDFMRVDVQGNMAKVVNKAGSSFNVGDIKWRNITATGIGRFEHEELGSDGTYYEGTITLVDENTLEISVASSGSGNTQKWVKNPPSPPATELTCAINTATTLVNGPAAVDYIVDCVVDVTAPLTIEPGVVIAFRENAGLGVYDNGTLSAVGTEEAPIVFKAENDTRGSWRGIYVETNSANNAFEYVTVKDAGSNYVYCCNEVASLYLKDGQMSITDSRFENGEGLGIYVRSGARLANYGNVVITSHDEYPLSIPMPTAGELDGVNSDYAGNGKSYIQINDGRLNEATEVQKANIPFLVDNGVLDITENLTLLAGAELVMAENTGLGVYDNGSLTLQGSATDPVVIRGKESIAGYWRGLHIETNSIQNVISYVKVSDAGSEYVYCCNTIASLYLKDGSASIDHTTVRNGASYGIYASDDFSFSQFQENVVTTHASYPLYIAAERAGELDGTNSEFSGNDKDFIGIFNSNVTTDLSWPKATIPYRVESVLDVTARVDIEEGAEIVFEENGGIGVYDNGILNASGTASEKIIFRGVEDLQGYWRGIHIETQSLSNVLNHVSVLNAGRTYIYCCNIKAGVLAKGGRLSMTNSQIANSGGCGISITNGGQLTESGNTFTNNADGNICN